MEVIADQQILRGVAATLSFQNVDAEGLPAAPAGAVTVGITRGDGTSLVAAGTATSGSSSAPRTYALSSANNQLLDILTVTWTDAGDASTHVTYVEVVGGFYFTVAEARASDAVLRDADKFPAALIVTTRHEVEEEFEAICGVSFVPRYRREVLPGSGYSSLILAHHPIKAVRGVWDYTDFDSYTAWTGDELSNLDLGEWGILTSRTGKTFGSTDRSLAVAYEHGMSRPPAEVKRAAMQRLRMVASKRFSGIPDRTETYNATEVGTFNLARASATSTGNDDIDAVLARWSRRTPGIA